MTTGSLVTARSGPRTPAPLTDPFDRWSTQAKEGKDKAASSWSFLASQSRGATLGIVQRVLLTPFFPEIDLDEVRIHTDEPADRAARLLGTDAFSLGHSIFFRTRKFDVATPRGLALLGHELVHARQVMRGEPIATTVRSDGVEQEAERTEGVLQRAFALGNRQGRERPTGAARGAEYRYAPVSIELARPFIHPSNGHDVKGGGVHSTPLGALPGTASKGQPLKAGEGRAIPSGVESSTPPVAAAEDAEGLTRNILRSLERKIRVEKERRGIDRWAH